MIILAPKKIKIKKDSTIEYTIRAEEEVIFDTNNDNLSLKYIDTTLYITGKKVGDANIIIKINEEIVMTIEVEVEDTLSYKPTIDFIKKTLRFFDYENIDDEYLQKLIDGNTEMVRTFIISNNYEEPTTNFYPAMYYITILVGENLSLNQVVNSDIVNYLREVKTGIMENFQNSINKKASIKRCVTSLDGGLIKV